jgi:hypothetical protein
MLLFPISDKIINALTVTFPVPKHPLPSVLILLPPAGKNMLWARPGTHQYEPPVKDFEFPCIFA